MNTPARGPVCFCTRRSGSKIAKAITWQPEPEQQPEQPGQQPERPEQQRQELEQQQERPEQQQPGLLFCHRR